MCSNYEDERMPCGVEAEVTNRNVLANSSRKVLPSSPHQTVFSARACTLLDNLYTEVKEINLEHSIIDVNIYFQTGCSQLKTSTLGHKNTLEVLTASILSLLLSTPGAGIIRLNICSMGACR